MEILDLECLKQYLGLHMALLLIYLLPPLIIICENDYKGKKKTPNLI